MVSLDGIPCKVRIIGNMQVTGDGQGHIGGPITYQCAWSDALSLFSYLLGYPPPPLFTGRPRPPHQHPLISSLTCRNVTIRGVGTPIKVENSAAIAYNLADVTAIYSNENGGGSLLQPNGRPPAKFNGLPDYATVSVESSFEMIGGGEKKFTIKDGSNPAEVTDVSQTKIVSISDYTITLNRVEDVDLALIESLKGCVNDATLFGFVAETFLFKSFSMSRIVDASFQFQPYQVTLNFSYRDVGWNRTWKPGYTYGNIPGEPEWGAIDPPPYKLEDLSQLF